MDPLLPQAKQLFPDTSDEELEQHIKEIRRRSPGLSDEQIVQMASQIKGAADSGEMNQKNAVNSYISQKYNIPSQYSPEARQALVDQNKADSEGLNWRAALATLGAGIAGKDPMSAGQGILARQDAERQGRLDAFDKARAASIADLDRSRSLEDREINLKRQGRADEREEDVFKRGQKKFEDEQRLIQESRDPNSERSKAAQQMLVEDFGMDPEKAKLLSAEQIEARIPTLKVKLDRQRQDREFSLREQEYKDKRSDSAIDRELKEREFGLREKIAASNDENEKARLQLQADEIKRKREELAANAGPGKLSEAQKQVDKDYAKQYNKFTATGYNNAKNAIEKMEKLASEMEKDTGLIESGGGGRISTLLPDALRSRDSIRRRDEARNYANTTLKELFGGQLSDDEREAAAKEYYNDALDNEENAKILRQKIKELKDNLESQRQQAEYYEKNGTLQGFKPISEKSSSGDFPRQVRKDGKVATVKNQQELDDAMNKGWQ